MKTGRIFRRFTLTVVCMLMMKYSLLFRCARRVENLLPHTYCGLHLITHLLLQ